VRGQQHRLERGNGRSRETLPDAASEFQMAPPNFSLMSSLVQLAMAAGSYSLAKLEPCFPAFVLVQLLKMSCTNGTNAFRGKGETGILS
jgi:hypothetical protein